MLYMIGTLSEIEGMEKKLPNGVFVDLVRSTSILDYEYGKDRDYRTCGGYSLVAETVEDVHAVKKYVDLDFHPCEWVERIGKNRDYLSALYVLNNDFSIMVYLPSAIAPTVILDEVGD